MNELTIKMTVAASPTPKTAPIPPKFSFGNTNPDSTPFQFISTAAPTKDNDEESPPPFLTPQERFKELASLPIGGAFLIATFKDSSSSPDEEEESLKVAIRKAPPIPHLAQSINVRFRFDKSGKSGRHRKWRRTNHAFLCPVLAGISILARHSSLGVQPTEPLGDS